MPNNTLRPIKPNPGSEKDPANFVGRRDVTRRARYMLANGQRIMLSDPRRMGKSFWIEFFTHETAQDKSFRVVLIDYQGVDSIDEFLTRTVSGLVDSQHLPRRFLDYLKGLFNNVEIELATGPVTLKKAAKSIVKPHELLETLLVRLNNEVNPGDPLLVVAMDEVADAVISIVKKGTPSDGQNLLQRLRRLREATPQIGWIMAGSIGFHHVLTRCDTTQAVLNNLDPLPFGPLNESDSAELAKRLALGITREIDDAAVARLYEVTDGIPYLIQELLHLMTFGERNKLLTGPITVAEVETVFEAFLANRDLSQSVTQFVSRIKDYYGDDQSLAYEILDAVPPTPAESRLIAVLPADLLKNEHFPQTLRNLIDDHYLLSTTTADGEALSWRYGVIARIYHHRRPTKG